MRGSVATIIALGVALCPMGSSADCPVGGFASAPSGDNLPENGRLFLEGFAKDAKAIAEIAERHPYFLCDGKKTDARIAETYSIPGAPELADGYGASTTVLLVPEHPLSRGQHCRLEFAAPLSDRLGKLFSGHKWTIVAAKTDAPRWLATPTEDRNANHNDLLGISVPFRMKLDQAPQLMLAELREVSAPANKAILYPVWHFDHLGDGWVRVAIGGAWECGGGFGIKPGKKYAVQFSVIDIAGHVVRSPSGVIEFLPKDPRNPVQETDEQPGTEHQQPVPAVPSPNR